MLVPGTSAGIIALYYISPLSGMGNIDDIDIDQYQNPNMNNNNGQSTILLGTLAWQGQGKRFYAAGGTIERLLLA